MKKQQIRPLLNIARNGKTATVREFATNELEAIATQADKLPKLAGIIESLTSFARVDFAAWAKESPELSEYIAQQEQAFAAIIENAKAQN
jgi:hypothetical protein